MRNDSAYATGYVRPRASGPPETFPRPIKWRNGTSYHIGMILLPVPASSGIYFEAIVGSVRDHHLRQGQFHHTMDSSTAPHLPKFSDLPLQESYPSHSAWGVWGDDDQLGCLNHLTPEVVLDAAREIRTGKTVGLSWELNQMRIPPWFRIKLQHKLISLADCINVCQSPSTLKTKPTKWYIAGRRIAFQHTVKLPVGWFPALVLPRWSVLQRSYTRRSEVWEVITSRNPWQVERELPVLAYLCD